MENGRYEWGDEERDADQESMHVLYKIPPGDGPYARAKHLQLVEKDLDASIPWFWKAVNSGDRIDSALKDMVVVMKQRERSEEAIEAIKSFRHLCSKQAQESLDNLLIDLYKKCGRTKEEIELLKRKLRKIYIGEAFHGKTTKRARSHGKKIQVSIKQETSRVLGNLAWAYMQQQSYIAAEVVYRKAQMIDPDANKACNLSVCLIEQGRLEEANQILTDILQRKYMTYSDSKIFKRAEELMARINSQTKFLIWDKKEEPVDDESRMEDDMIEILDMAIKQWAPFRSKRLLSGLRGCLFLKKFQLSEIQLLAKVLVDLWCYIYRCKARYIYGWHMMSTAPVDQCLRGECQYFWCMLIVWVLLCSACVL